MDPKDKRIPTSAERQAFLMQKEGIERIAKAVESSAGKDVPITISVNGHSVKDVKVTSPKGEDGKDGKDGKTPKKGVDYFTPEEAAAFASEVLASVHVPKDGKDGKDAEPVDYAKLEAFIVSEVSKIPKPTNGKDGKDAVVDYASIIKTVLEKIKPEEVNYDLVKRYIQDKIDNTALGSYRTLNSGGPTTRLGELVDINVQDVETNQVLGWNGTQWVAMDQTGGGGGGTWGSITGTLSAQTDLQSALDAKGTFTLPALTTGSVLFSDGSTVAQDNANLFWDNANNRLGIGTTTPATTLDVYGGSNLVSIGRNSGTDDTDANQLTIRTRSYVGNKTIRNIDRGGSDNFYVTDQGKVAIGTYGTLGAGYSLGVNGGAIDINGNQAGFQISDRTTTTDKWQHYSSGGIFRIYRLLSAVASEPFNITASTGNVGIGHATGTSATRRLDIVDSTNNYQLRIGSTGNFTYDIGRDNSNGYFIFYGNQTGANGYIFTGINGERMRIDTSGNVMMGIATAGAKLHTVSTTEQFRVGYDVSNYYSTTVSAAGVTTFNAVGASASFVFSDDVSVPDEAYGAGWNGSLEVPTKNAVYDKIETLGAAGVTSIAGTANQIDASAATGAVTLSLPSILNAPGGFLTSGSNSTTSATVQVLSSANTSYSIRSGLGTSTLAVGYNYASIVTNAPTITEAASGTHALIAGQIIKAPIITDGGATTTNAATVYIEGAPTGTATPSNVYSLWVDAGEVKLDAGLSVGTSVGVGTTALASTGLLVAGTGYTSNLIAATGSLSPTAGTNATLYRIAGTIVEAASGTHNLMSAMFLGVTTVTGGAATVNNSAGLYIEGPMTATVAGKNYSVWIDDGITRIDGAVEHGYVAKTAAYTLTDNDYTVDATSGTFAFTLPTAVGITGRVYVLKNSGSGTITINTTSSQTVDGSASGAISFPQYNSYTVQSNGTNWIII